MQLNLLLLVTGTSPPERGVANVGILPVAYFVMLFRVHASVELKSKKAVTMQYNQPLMVMSSANGGAVPRY